jgi:hypothetical protein
MNDSCFDLQILRARMSGIGERLEGPWAETLDTHRHLDRDAPECAYWHSGYHQALADILHLIGKARPTSDNADTSNLRLAAG